MADRFLRTRGERPLVRLCVLLLLLVLTCAVHAQSRTDSTKLTHADSLLIQADTAKKAAAPELPRFFPLRWIGSILSINDTSHTISQHDLIYSAVNETFDALRFEENVYPLSLGTAGQNSDLLINGLDMRNTAVMLDGRPMNEPLTGRFSFMHLAPEFPERMEVITGPRATVYGFDAITAAINVTPEIFNTNRPYVRVRYYQSPYDFLSSDIAASQNITRSLNFSFGVDRESQLGEYINNNLQYWNVRGGLRWFADSTFNLLLTENFTHNHAGTNGGLYGTDVNVENLLARVDLPAADVEDFRHDVTLTGAWGGAADSLDRTNASIYYSSLIKDYISQQDPFSDLLQPPFVTANQENAMRWLGADVRHVSRYEGFKITAGAAVQDESADADTVMPAEKRLLLGAYGIAEQSVDNVIDLAAYARFDRIGSFFRPTIGADAHLHLGDHVTLTAALARTERVPTLQELYWSSPELIGNSSLVNEQHNIASVGMLIQAEGFKFDLTASSRNITHFIEAQPRSDTVYAPYVIVQPNSEQLYTLGASLSFTIGKFSAEGNGLVTIMREQSVQLQSVPVFSGIGGLYWHDPQFFGYPLDMKAGVEGRFTSSFIGQIYLPDAQYFVGDAGYQAGLNGSLDAGATFHLGTAYLRLGMTNILDTRFYYTPFYPINNRSFYLGFTWAFFD